MLARLEVRDFANISQAHIELPQSGYCVLTGETGVGKSLLVDALALASGGRQSRDLVRHGSDNAEVSAAFDLTDNSQARRWMQDNGMDAGQELVVRRTIDGNRRSRVHINGKLATLAQLAEVVGLLVSICGQNEHIRLRQAKHRRALLDAAAGAEELAAATAAAYDSWRGATAALETAEKGAATAKARREEIGHQLQEVDELGFTAEAWTENSSLHQTQANAAEIMDLYDGISGGIDELEKLAARLAQSFDRLTELMPSASTVAGQMNDLLALANDVARDCARLGEDIGPVDEKRLAEIDAFVAEAHRLARKHGLLDPAALVGHVAQLREELESISAQGLETAKAAEQRAKDALAKLCTKLTAARSRTAKVLSAKVEASLRRLGIKEARFKVVLDPLGAPARHGAEDTGFLFAARAKSNMAGLGEAASGGELSRASLALFSHVGGDGGRDLVFDEVDAGVGGKVAAYVGSLLAELGTGRLVLCVTHLPQVAASANEHWVVSAKADGSATLRRVQGEAREEEIARMLAGRKVTEASRSNARDILAAASSA